MTEAGGCIYAFRSGDFIKIGYSTRPVGRARHLGAMTPFPTVLLGTIPGSRYDEGVLHRKLAPHHHRHEWFRAEGAVLEFVATLKRPRDWLFVGDARRQKHSPERIEKMRQGVSRAHRRRRALIDRLVAQVDR